MNSFFHSSRFPAFLVSVFINFVIGSAFLSCNKDSAAPKPTFTSFDPVSGYAPLDTGVGTTVTIMGTNFNTNLASDEIKFNGVTATVSSATSSEVKVTVPAGATTGKISVTVNGNTISSDQDFVITNPTITSFTPTSAGWGAWITITGTGFDTNVTGNKVYVGSRFATVISATATSLVAQVPIGAATGKITVVVNKAVGRSANDFTLVQSWVAKADYPGPGTENIGFSFVINGKAYVGASGEETNSTRNKSFYEYDPATNTWTQKKTFPGQSRISAAGFSIGSKGYMGTGYIGITSNNDLNDFWQYDPSTDNWTQLNNFPGAAREGAVAFAIGTKGYMATGWSNQSGTSLKDVWQYDPSNDSWTQLADFPGATRYRGYATTIGSNGYISGGLFNPGINSARYKDLWEFNPSTGWTQKTDSPDLLNGEGQIAFTLNNKAYVGGFFLFEYDPALNKWTQKATLTSNPFRGVGFAIGNYGYATGGEFGNASKALSQYTPE